MLDFEIPKCPLHRSVLTVAGVTDGFSGKTLALYAQVSLPNAEQTRRTLLRLRREHHFSRGKLAALLAVSPQTLRRWEDGTRRPCATARRVVQLVERLYFRPGDFPTKPLHSVFREIMKDFEDKMEAMKRDAKAAESPPLATS